ncbi:MAG: hypothetical protein ACD_8C00096G0005 [uncultured bacterium]|nr:MAG: hypothetical protein ACD_8C00096G0005 [uncultured bacterium]
MKIKKACKQFFSVSLMMVMLAVFSFVSIDSVSAVDWNTTIDGNGNVSGCIGSSGSCGGGSWDSFMSSGYGLPTGPEDGITGILSGILFWLLGIFGILGIIGFVLSGIWYLLSAGEESMAEKGKAGMKWSIIGIIVGLSGLIIIRAVGTMLSGGSEF